MLFIGLATLTTYQVFFLIDHLGVAPADIPGKMLTATLIFTAATVVGSLGGGWLSDRLSARRKLFVLLAAVIYAIDLLLVALSASFNGFLLGLTVCGLCQGIHFAVDLALVAQVRNDAFSGVADFDLAERGHRAGRWTGPRDDRPRLRRAVFAAFFGSDHAASRAC